MKPVGIVIWDSHGRRDLVEYLSEVVGRRKRIDKGIGKEREAKEITTLELQVEGIYDDSSSIRAGKADWHHLDYKTGFLGDFFSKLSYISVHAPCRGRNIASLDDEHRAWSVEETKMAMDFAKKINAKSFVMHAGRVDDWEEFQPELRQRNESAFYKSFSELADHYITIQPGFNMLVENLEVPHLTATKSEHERACNICSRILSEKMEERGVSFSNTGVKMLVDFSHYWNSHITLRENPSKKFVDGYDEITGNDLISYLDNFIRVNRQRIAGIHLGGCYNSAWGRSTHGHIMPIARHYDYFELNLMMVLDLVLKHNLDVPMSLEVFNTDVQMVIASYQNVVEYFEERENKERR